jgi:predicted SAM-dependent methyltransferase
MSMRKLHIGGWVRTPGWEVIDANPGPNVDHVGDAGDLSRFDTATFTVVYAAHVLEHFDYKDELFMTLVEWCRVLVPGGTLHVSVPDMDILARLFIEREQLSKGDRFMAMRMIFGGHVDQYDYHLVGLNDELLADLLSKTGFTDIRRVAELGLFEDTSKLIFCGVPISLNMTAVKSTL